jgi:hypothetical protein
VLPGLCGRGGGRGGNFGRNNEARAATKGLIHAWHRRIGIPLATRRRKAPRHSSAARKKKKAASAKSWAPADIYADVMLIRKAMPSCRVSTPARSRATSSGPLFTGAARSVASRDLRPKDRPPCGPVRLLSDAPSHPPALPRPAAPYRHPGPTPGRIFYRGA